MSFLPIAERELQVACRKPSTFWLRVGAALVALIIGSGFLARTLVPFSHTGAVGLGRGLFVVLTWISLAATLSAGLFFTSDCLSQEKREGTLGFLFLTDLRGYDVVLGKLFATSVRGFYAFLAIFPVLAISLLVGGVSGGQFWRSFLALVNALFVSLAAGLLVSSLSRDSQKALPATLLLLVFLAVGGPAADSMLAFFHHRGIEPLLSLFSPVYLFVTAGRRGGAPFWLGLTVNQAIGWSLLGLTCVLLPRTWQDRGQKNGAVRAGWRHTWRFGGASRRLARRRQLIELNPALWLACRERWQPLALWGLAILAVGGFVGAFASRRPSAMSLAFVWSPLAAVLTLVFYLGMTSQAARFFVEARRNGLLELMLVTPLTGDQIAQGQWRGLLRLFSAPVLLFLVADLVGGALAQERLWNSVTSLPPPRITVGRTNPAGRSAMTTGATARVVRRPGALAANRLLPRPGMAVGFGLAAVGRLATIANLAALAWFGMWMGLTSKTANAAILKTLLFVEVVPAFAISIAANIALPLFLFPAILRRLSVPVQTFLSFQLLRSALTTMLVLGKDVGFVVWARWRLCSDFRQRAVEGGPATGSWRASTSNSGRALGPGTCAPHG